MNATAGPVLELAVFETDNITPVIPSALSSILLTCGAGSRTGGRQVMGTLDSMANLGIYLEKLTKPGMFA